MITGQNQPISKKEVKEIIRQAKQSDWPHLLFRISEHGKLEASGIGGRTDLVPMENQFFLLNVHWESEDTIYYAFRMLVKNRNGYYIVRDE